MIRMIILVNRRFENSLKLYKRFVVEDCRRSVCAERNRRRAEYFHDGKKNSPKAGRFFDTRCSNVDAPAVRKSRKYLLGSAIGWLSSLCAPLTPNGMKINYFVNSCVTLAVTEPSLWTTAAQGTIFQFPMSPYLFDCISVWYRRAILRPYLLSRFHFVSCSIVAWPISARVRGTLFYVAWIL